MSDHIPPARDYLQNNRGDLMKLLKHGDPTLRALAIAVLLEAGTEAEIEEVQEELDLYKRIYERRDN